VDVWLRHEDVAIRRARREHLLGGSEDLGAGLELSVVGRGGEPVIDMEQVGLQSANGAFSQSHRDGELGGTNSAVENMTKGEESEKACAPAKASNAAAAMESCMVA
jgi:hypothetical protein